MIHPRSIQDALKEAVNGPGFLNYMNDYKVVQGKALFEKDLEAYRVLDGYGPFLVQDERFKAWPQERIPVESSVPALFLVGTFECVQRTHAAIEDVVVIRATSYPLRAWPIPKS